MVCDSSPLAIAASRKRLTSMDAPYVYYISEKEKNSTSATVKAEVETRETISRQALCRVRLTKYERSCRNLPVSDVEKAALEKLQAADPLALVDYWCIDRNYDGVNFQTQQWFAREKADLRTEAEFLTGPARRAAIKVYDVFGGFGIMEIQV